MELRAGNPPADADVGAFDAVDDPSVAVIDRVEAVYRRDHERLWRSLLGYLGDPDLAAEAESEAFAQALGRGAALRDPAAWIWRTAFRVAAGMAADRSNHRQRTVPIVADHHESAVPAAEPLIEILSVLIDLSPQQRAVTALRYGAGLKPSEIAEVLDTTPGSVRVQLHRSHEALRQSWSDR